MDKLAELDKQYTEMRSTILLMDKEITKLQAAILVLQTVVAPLEFPEYSVRAGVQVLQDLAERIAAHEIAAMQRRVDNVVEALLLIKKGGNIGET